MIGRRAQGLVAVTVALAGMAVLLAAGGAPAQVDQPLQPTDPGEFVPSSLSHHAFALWARADGNAEQAAETFGGRIDRCRRTVKDPNRLGGCIGRVVNGLHVSADAAVSNARILFPAGGACERALRIYVHSLSAYTAALTWFDQGVGQRPYSRVGLIGLRQDTHGAAGTVFSACGSFL
ncbi:MAG: hypothetical protein ACJ738_13335 [Gaiellales bacterium]|jgi:hypothetical protein